MVEEESSYELVRLVQFCETHETIKPHYYKSVYTRVSVVGFTSNC
jgi:hypothetical protein